VAWTDHWLVFHLGLWWMVEGENDARVVKATDITSEDFFARDWTTEEVSEDVCGALPAYNTTAPIYNRWTDQPIFTPPPIPGFSDEEEG
jgi:hypothetical protein